MCSCAMESIVEAPQVLDGFAMEYDDFGDFPDDEAAHFFDEPPSRGHTDIRSHLEGLAQRHPEFADHLRYPAWSEEPKTNTWGRKRRGSEEQDKQQEPSKQQNKEERGRAKENLRNTVPDMGQKQQQEKEERGQRSWSAPPPDSRDERPRFVSKIEIQPVNPDAKPQPQPQPQQSGSTGDATKPPMAPPKPQPPPQANQQPQHKTSTVRHIPIFVEGRDEPLLPKEPEFTQHAAPQTHYQPQRKQTPPRFEQSQPRFEKEVPIQRFEKEVPIQPRFEREVPVQSGQPRFENEVPIQTRYEQQNPPQQSQPEPQQPVNRNDPLYRVECVQKEVDELKTRIDNFNGTSRKDKEYIYLDEMLTRNLIKLDTVETEGREEVRAARKNTIKSIQNCINELEGKVPLPEQQKTEAEGEKMETEQTSQDGSGDGQSVEGKPKTEQTEKPMEVEPEKPDGATSEAADASGNEQPAAAEKQEVNEVNESTSSEVPENKAA